LENASAPLLISVRRSLGYAKANRPSDTLVFRYPAAGDQQEDDDGDGGG
jgi:hypothetical protein